MDALERMAINAVTGNDIKELDRLIKTGWIDPNMTYGAAHMTLLMLAALNENCEAARFLIKSGTKVNAQNSYGSTALYFAAFVGSEEMTQLLLDSGADAFMRTEKSETALACAAKLKHDGVARILTAHMITNAPKDAMDFGKALEDAVRMKRGEKSKEEPQKSKSR